MVSRLVSWPASSIKHHQGRYKDVRDEEGGVVKKRISFFVPLCLRGKFEFDSANASARSRKRHTKHC